MFYSPLGPDSGVGRAWEAVFGSTLAFTFKGAVIAATVGSLPLVIRSVRLGLESVEPNLIAAARTLGARPARIFVTVTLPLAAPGLVAGAMLCYAATKNPIVYTGYASAPIARPYDEKRGDGGERRLRMRAEEHDGPRGRFGKGAF